LYYEEGSNRVKDRLLPFFGFIAAMKHKIAGFESILLKLTNVIFASCSALINYKHKIK